MITFYWCLSIAKPRLALIVRQSFHSSATAVCIAYKFTNAGQFARRVSRIEYPYRLSAYTDTAGHYRVVRFRYFTFPTMHRIEFVFIRFFSDIMKWPRPGFNSATVRVDVFNDDVIVIAEILVVLGKTVLKRRAFVTPSTWL